MARLDIPVSRILDHGIALDEIADALIKRMGRLKARRLNLGVGHDIVALVRVLPDGGIEKDKIWNLFLDTLAKFPLGDVRIGQAEIGRAHV